MITTVATTFVLALASVTMWTLRVIVASRGRRMLSPVIAAGEALVFVLAFSHIAADVASPARLVSYAAGVAGGTALALGLNDRVDREQAELHIIAPGDHLDWVGCLHDRGWPATASSGSGPNGTVTMAWLAVPTGEVAEVATVVERCAPGAFLTANRTGSSPPAATSRRGRW